MGRLRHVAFTVPADGGILGGIHLRLGQLVVDLCSDVPSLAGVANAAQLCAAALIATALDSPEEADQYLAGSEFAGLDLPALLATSLADVPDEHRGAALAVETRIREVRRSSRATDETAQPKTRVNGAVLAAASGSPELVVSFSEGRAVLVVEMHFNETDVHLGARFLQRFGIWTTFRPADAPRAENHEIVLGADAAERKTVVVIQSV